MAHLTTYSRVPGGIELAVTARQPHAPITARRRHPVLSACVRTVAQLTGSYAAANRGRMERYVRIELGCTSSESQPEEWYSPSISGEFRIDGQRASGTVSGFLETRDRYSGTMFWGSLTISYQTASGEMCQSESLFSATGGSASEKAVFFFTEEFPKGNCPDLPTKVNITLRR